MLETLITSRTRLKMLLRLFINGTSSSYLRELAQEFGESTNSIRVELNHLTKAGYLESIPAGRIIRYRANVKHPLFADLQRILLKYVGIDRIIDQVVSRLGDLHYAFITGDYAMGKDTGTVEVLLVGEVNKAYLDRLVVKARPMLPRRIRARVLSLDSFAQEKEFIQPRLLIFEAK